MSHVELQREWVTPQIADEWLTSRHFPRQRPLRQRWVEELAKLLQTDKWEPGLVKFHHYDGQWWTIDGQHRLHSIVKANLPAFLNCEYTYGSSLNEARLAYERTDGNLPRSAADILKASGLTERTRLSALLAKNVLGAVRFINKDYFSYSTKAHPEERSKELQINMVGEWEAEALAYKACVRGSDRWLQDILCKVGPLAVLLTIIRYRPEDACLFLTKLAENSGLEKGDPIHALTRHFMSSVSLRYSANYEARAVAMAWNCWSRKRMLSLIKITDEKAELVLEFTPLVSKSSKPPQIQSRAA